MKKLIDMLLEKFHFDAQQSWLKGQIEKAQTKAELKKIILANMVITKELENEIDAFDITK